jgi:hypothetical protein
VALSYATFAIVSVLAMIHDLPLDTCGCLGRVETPPSWWHLVVIGVAFAGAVGVAIDPEAAVVDEMGRRVADGALFAAVVVVGTAVAIALMRTGGRRSAHR